MQRPHRIAAAIGVCIGLLLTPPAQALIDQKLDSVAAPMLPGAIASGTISLEQAAAVQQLAFSPDGHYLLTAHVNRSVRVWDVTHHQAVSRFSYATDQDVLAVAFSPDAQYLATVYNDTVRIWAVQQGEVVA